MFFYFPPFPWTDRSQWRTGTRGFDNRGTIRHHESPRKYKSYEVVLTTDSPGVRGAWLRQWRSVTIRVDYGTDSTVRGRWISVVWRRSCFVWRLFSYSVSPLDKVPNGSLRFEQIFVVSVSLSLGFRCLCSPDNRTSRLLTRWRTRI